MHVIKARNVNDALFQAIPYLARNGIQRDSRNGPVLLSPEPVTTVYDKPCERVLFWAERDANPFFHLYESLWMLAGRNDVAGVARYAKQMLEYSDDGKTLHGAYGYRWRQYFNESESDNFNTCDQLQVIAEALQNNRDDRRQVLGMWDPEADLGRQGRDLPCNLMATFQINTTGALDLSVFNRSNDIIWGAYGANAVHFSFLLEYMARWIGVPVGRYYQISINWHGYLETFEPLLSAKKDEQDLYVKSEVRPLLFPDIPIEEINKKILEVLEQIDRQYLYGHKEEFWKVVSTLLYAHDVWKETAAPGRYDTSLRIIDSLDPTIDFVRACSEWILRRKARWEAKMRVP